MRRGAWSFFASAALAGSIASRNGSPMATPAARRTVRRSSGLSGMGGSVGVAVPGVSAPGSLGSRSLVHKHAALHHFVNERAEAVIFAAKSGHDPLDLLAVGELDVGARRVHEQLFREVA